MVQENLYTITSSFVAACFALVIISYEMKFFKYEVMKTLT